MNRKDLISEVSEKTGYYKKDINKILDAMDEVVIRNLSQSSLNQKVEVRVASGVSIKSEYVDTYLGVNPRTQAQEEIKKHVILKPHCTTTFKNSVNEVLYKNMDKRSN